MAGGLLREVVPRESSLYSQTSQNVRFLTRSQEEQITAIRAECFEDYMPLSFECEKSKNNMNLTKVRSWLTETDCFFFSGR